MTSKQQAITDAEALGVPVDPDSQTEAQIREAIEAHQQALGTAPPASPDNPTDGRPPLGEVAAQRQADEYVRDYDNDKQEG